MKYNSPFKIETRFIGGLSETQKQVFELAARRWSELIIADVPNVLIPDFGEVDDLVIDAQGINIDQVGGVLGRAGPTMIRAGSFIPARGIMEFDTADLENMEANGSLFNVIVHEMGHVLGIGTLWKAHGLIEGSGTDDPLFVGANTMREYANLTGASVPQKVPIANTGSPGTREGHWREDVFDYELMTGYLDSGSNPLSRLTIASLQDIGYQVDYNFADAYQLPSDLEREVVVLVGHQFCDVERPVYEILPESVEVAAELS